MKATEWRVLRDRGPLEMPRPGDVLATIVAADKAEAQATAERMFAQPVVVVPSHQWPHAPALRFDPDCARPIQLATADEEDALRTRRLSDSPSSIPHPLALPSNDDH